MVDGGVGFRHEIFRQQSVQRRDAVGMEQEGATAAQLAQLGQTVRPCAFLANVSEIRRQVSFFGFFSGAGGCSGASAST